MVERKSEGIAILLALSGGVLGFSGIGHFYASKIGKGLLIMFMGFVYEAVTTTLFIAFTGAAMKHEHPDPWWLLSLLMWFIFFIWQIFDARAVCRMHNIEVMTGRYNVPYPQCPPPYGPGRM